MKISNDLTGILKEVKLLKEVDDNFGHALTEDKTKGIFVQVVDYGEGKEYLIEANNIDNEGCFEPCGDWNLTAEFEDYEQFIIEVVSCIENQLVT